MRWSALLVFGLALGASALKRDGATRRWVDKQQTLHNISGMIGANLDKINRVSYSLGQDKLVILTSANAKYKDLLLNLFEGMKRVGRQKLLVFCEGDVSEGGCEQEMAQEGLEFIDTGRHFDSFTNESYNKITAAKPSYVMALLEHGYTVLWTDSDISWMKDPWPYFESKRDFSFIVQDDDPWPHVPDDTKYPDVPEDELLDNRWWPVCSGFFLVRPTPTGRGLVSEWLSRLEFGRSDVSQRDFRDQRELKVVLWEACAHVCSDEIGCQAGSDCLLLPRRIFPNGSVPPSDWSTEANIIHLNHDGRMGLEVKAFKMYMEGVWYLDHKPWPAEWGDVWPPPTLVAAYEEYNKTGFKKD